MLCGGSTVSSTPLPAIPSSTQSGSQPADELKAKIKYLENRLQTCEEELEESQMMVQNLREELCADKSEHIMVRLSYLNLNSRFL